VYAWGSGRHIGLLQAHQASDAGASESKVDGEATVAQPIVSAQTVCEPAALPAFGGEDWVTRVFAGKDHCAFLVGGASLVLCWSGDRSLFSLPLARQRSDFFPGGGGGFLFLCMTAVCTVVVVVCVWCCPLCVCSGSC